MRRPALATASKHAQVFVSAGTLRQAPVIIHLEETMLDKAPNARMAAFLGKFDAALAVGDVEAAAAMFGVESYWRDLVAFTWNIKTMEGRDQVRDMLTHRLKQVKPRDWRVAEGEVATEADGILESWISFETEIARGYGLIRIKDGAIWTLLTTMAELKGHEEKAGFTRLRQCASMSRT